MMKNTCDIVHISDELVDSVTVWKMMMCCIYDNFSLVVFYMFISTSFYMYSSAVR